MPDEVSIPGYAYGSPELAPSPLSLAGLDLLKQATAFSTEDERYLRKAGEVLKDQVEELLDVWYGFVGAHPHLVAFFAGSDGKPSTEYLEAVRRRFGQWVLDTCRRPYDQAWLDYQHEIGLRHHRTKKNWTDRAGAAGQVPARYLVAFIAPIALTTRPFLEKGGDPPAEVDKMFHAWLKAVTLQVALWLHPYVKEGDF